MSHESIREISHAQIHFDRSDGRCLRDVGAGRRFREAFRWQAWTKKSLRRSARRRERRKSSRRRSRRIRPSQPETPQQACRNGKTRRSAEGRTNAAIRRAACGVGKKAEPGKTNSSKDGQVTFEDKKPAAAKDRPLSRRSPQRGPGQTRGRERAEQKTAKADKPRRKRSHHWNEARIMRELHRYGVMAGGWGGW